MKFIIKLLIIFSTLSFLGCGLDRSNPLDPENGEINTPKLVTNISLSSSGQGAITKYVTISWGILQENGANGYFIYRSRAYEGAYDLITEIFDREQSSYTDNDKISTGAYFYKMSAFVYLNPGSPNNNERLEGPLNRPGEPGIMVPQ
jgi:hypothetical protein